jgi:hypothetical protein
MSIPLANRPSAFPGLTRTHPSLVVSLPGESGRSTTSCSASRAVRNVLSGLDAASLALLGPKRRRFERASADGSPGTHRREVAGGTENRSTDLPGERTRIRRSDCEHAPRHSSPAERRLPSTGRRTPVDRRERTDRRGGGSAPSRPRALRGAVHVRDAPSRVQPRRDTSPHVSPEPRHR